MKIGFVGLGIMGRPMAKNILKSGGHTMRFYARRSEVIAEMEALHAEFVPAPDQLGKGCDVVFTMLPDGPDVKNVVLGEGGVAAGMEKGSVLIDCSSINPEDSREIAEGLKRRGIEMLDAPVTGGESGAIDGTLAVMVGGERPVFDRCEPLLAEMASSVTYCGKIGSGNTVKLVNQVIVAGTLAAISEGVLLAAQAGIDPELVLGILRGGMAGSRILESKLPKMIARDFAPGFKMDLQIKDLRNALAFGRSEGVPMPMTAQVTEEMQEVSDQGFGNDDHSVLIRYYQNRMR